MIKFYLNNLIKNILYKMKTYNDDTVILHDGDDLTDS